MDLRTALLFVAISLVSLDCNAASPVANREQVDQAVVYGSLSTPTLRAEFGASTYVTTNGTMEGWISVSLYDVATSNRLDFAFCQGSAYAGALLVNSANGDTRLSAVLDAADPNCDVQSGRVGIDIYGRANGQFHKSETHSGVERYPVARYRFSNSFDTFSMTFTGTNGMLAGGYEGAVEVTLSSTRERID